MVQTGDADPGGAVHGYVASGTTTERKIPLEIAMKVIYNIVCDTKMNILKIKNIVVHRATRT